MVLPLVLQRLPLKRKQKRQTLVPQRHKIRRTFRRKTPTNNAPAPNVRPPPHPKHLAMLNNVRTMRRLPQRLLPNNEPPLVWLMYLLRQLPLLKLHGAHVRTPPLPLVKRRVKPPLGTQHQLQPLPRPKRPMQLHQHLQNVNPKQRLPNKPLNKQPKPPLNGFVVVKRQHRLLPIPPPRQPQQNKLLPHPQPRLHLKPPKQQFNTRLPRRQPLPQTRTTTRRLLPTPRWRLTRPLLWPLLLDKLTQVPHRGHHHT